MKKAKSFILLTLLGGLGVLLPVAVFAIFVNWLFHFSTDLIQPLTNLVTHWFGKSELVSDFIVFGFMLASCFAAGLVAKTSIGRWVHGRFDHVLIQLAPGYKTIKEIIGQLLGLGSGKDSLMSGEVVMAYLFGRDTPTTVMAIVTSRHANGNVTVYVPTAPVPTSGITYHVSGDCVEPLPGVSVEEAMRTIIACGAGTAALLEQKD